MSASGDFTVSIATSFSALEYRDLGMPGSSDVRARFGGDQRDKREQRKQADFELSKEEFAELMRKERAEAALQAEQRVTREWEQKLQSEKAAIAVTLRAFETERVEYYSRVEAEVVQLALGIAAKILHREVQIDPMLLSALVRMAVEQMREGSSVTVRVTPKKVAFWKDYFAAQMDGRRVEVEGDASLSDLDCILETELGTTNFGLDGQLKEIERGFFDLLALRPVAG